MHPKIFFQWLYGQGKSYNLFMLEEHDYHDDNDDDNGPPNPEAILQEQKYTTWLYVILLMVSLYVLFYITLMTPHSQTITVSSITPKLFEQLYLEHPETLSCPCSSISLSHKKFISNRITFHPICSSIFISRQWIEALYLIDASDNGIPDFRTTAKSQFQLLADLCSMSMDTVSQTQTDFDNDEFITINLLPEEQIQSELNVAVNNVQNSISTRIISFLNYIRIYVRSNYIASALNTNLMLATYLDGKQYTIYQLQTQYTQDTSISLSTTLTMMCGSQNPIIPTGFFPIPIIYGIFTRNRWPTNVADFIPVKGFYTACTALEALLASTFDCLYDIRCIQLLSTKFPSLNLRDFNMTNLTLASNQQNITVYDHLLKLFIQDWSTEISYPKYFNACAPASCSYIIENESNLSYAFAIFISLYGGLIIILRLMSPVLIKILLKMKQCLTGRIVHVVFRNMHPKKVVKSIKQLNLFKNIDHRSPDDIKQQKITTRVYLFLLACSFMILITFTSLETQVVSITVSNPSLTTYNKLEKLYSDTLRCPCSITAVPYDRFMTLSPTLHQICSSDFVKDRWLTIVQSAADYTTEDWRNRAYSQHQLLSHLCQLARNTIDDAVQQFLLQSFIVSSVLSQSEFNTQLNATLNQLFEVTIRSFGSLIDIAALFTQVDQPYLGARKPNWEAVPDKFLTGDIFASNGTKNQSMRVVFNLFGTTYVNLSSVNCICAKNSACQTPVAVYQMDSIWNSRIHAYISYIVPGAIRSCSTYSSLMFSQLLCFYSNTSCFSILINYIKDTYYQNVEFSTWFDPNPLVYDPKSSRYPPDTTVSTIVEQIMIEQWNPSYSYNDFYQTCAPKSCTYYQRANAKSIFEVIITFISMIGGLTLALKLITPLFIKLIGGLLTVIVRKPRQKIEQTVTIRRSTSDQMKTTVKNVVVYVYDQAINMNIFSMRDLGSNIDRNTAKQLGKWATRLHIALFIVGLAILTLHTSIQPQTVTRIFNKPSFNSYNKLRKEYGDQLKCSCSVIASKYNQFVQIEPIYHQICKSQFTSDQWRNDVTSGLTSNLSMYEQRDYRRFLSAHLQYLQGLCQLSIRSIDNAIEQFLTSLFITNELLSNDTFHARLSFLIEQEKSNAPNTFIRLFFLMRSINQGNAYVTTYGTNFEYVSPWFADTTYYPVFLSRAIIYDNNCSCGIHSNCTVPANIIGVNGTVISSVKGLKMGCTPSESLHSSTLECFYNQSCINLLKLSTDSILQMNSSTPLSITMSRFLMNTTVTELMNELFVEQWVPSINYTSYFEHCLPLLCSYIYDEPFNILYLVTVIIGLQGGLTIVLAWICPKFIRILANLNKYRKKRLNVIQAESSVQTTTTDIDTIRTTSMYYAQSMPRHVPSEKRVESLNRRRMKIILSCLVVLILIIALILFSFYINRVRKQDTISTTTASTMSTSLVTSKMTTSTTTTTTMTTSTTHMPICQLQFQATIRYKTGSTAGLKSPVVADFNGDNLLDIAFFNYGTSSIHVLIGDGRGNYTAEFRTIVQKFTTWYFSMAVADFNNDRLSDIVLTSENKAFVYIILGNGNGTFRSFTTYFMGDTVNLRGIVAYDFNGDNNTDIAVSAPGYNLIIILLGNGDGTFSNKTTYFAGRNANPSSVDMADFNGDGHQDICYNNIVTRGVGVLLGRGDGTFEDQKASFVGGFYQPSYIAVGDFNADQRPDVAVSYSGGKSLGVLLGYGNGTLTSVAKFPVGNKTFYIRISAGDFNNDGIWDIVANPTARSVIYVLVGYGDGNFDTQMIFSANMTGGYTWVVPADFNNDGCQDILATDDQAGAVFVLMNSCACQTTPIIRKNTTMRP